ncbi:MAG: helix-turn-helix domain-containing protein [Pseudomonadota bacterium]
MDLLKSRETADYLKLSERTLTQMRSEGSGPPFVRLYADGRGVRYRRADLDAWLETKGGACVA